MARKTVKIPVSTTDAAALVKLASAIAVRQSGDFADPSLAAAVNWTRFNADADQAKKWQDEIDKLTRELEELTGKRDNLVGKAEGQTVQTVGTLLFEIMRVRDILLGVARGKYLVQLCIKDRGFSSFVFENEARYFGPKPIPWVSDPGYNKLLR